MGNKEQGAKDEKEEGKGGEGEEEGDLEKGRKKTWKKSLPS